MGLGVNNSWWVTSGKSAGVPIAQERGCWDRDSLPSVRPPSPTLIAPMLCEGRGELSSIPALGRRAPSWPELKAGLWAVLPQESSPLLPPGP